MIFSKKKTSTGTSKLEACKGGVLTMRVTSQHSDRCDLMRNSYLGSVQQKYRCAPLIQNVTDEKKEDEEIHLDEDKLWTVVETLRETTLTLNVPSMFLRARASELKRRQRRLHLWAQAVTRALGHFTHSSSSRQADADARAAGWSIVHLDIVRFCLFTYSLSNIVQHSNTTRSNTGTRKRNAHAL